MKTKQYFSLILFVLTIWANQVKATTYYISPTGINSNSGTSAATAWQTIAKANGTFVAGDTILFEGGQSFAGTLTPANSGTIVNRITFGSYGIGRATISSASAGGLVINGKSYITVKDLIFRGDWQNATYTAVSNGSNSALGVRLYGTPSNLLLDNLQISGYGNFGIQAQSGDSNITITRFDIHDNKDSGIRFSVLSGAAKHTNVSITNGSSYKNRGWGSPNSSGDGIQLADANGALIERCIAYENGKECTTTGGGPVGIWSWRSNNVIIQYCIAYRNGNAGSWDGGGFDIDGGNGNCIMQYNYSFENEGAGFLFAAFATADGVNNGVVRYNLSVNDATKGVVRNQSSIHVWTAGGNAATSMQNVYIYNNTVVQNNGASSSSCFQTGDGDMTNVRVFNNLFIAGRGRYTTKVNYTTGISMQGNLYYCMDAPTNPRIVWGNSLYTSLAAFRSATGQEMLSGNPVGLNVNPILNNAAAVPPLLTAWSQTATQLNPWQLTSGSPALNSALSAISLIGATTSSTTYGAGSISHPGTTDLFGTTIPSGSAFDMGAYEYEGPLPVSLINFTGKATAMGNVLSWRTTAEQSNKGFEILRSKNGIDFEKIGFKNSLDINGNSSTPFDYYFSDNTSDSDLYYQLKQVDLDGKSKTSTIIIVKAGFIVEHQIYPNPITDNLNILLDANKTDMAIINITNQVGKVVLTLQETLKKGNNTIKLSTLKLAAGWYLLNIKDSSGNAILSRKIIKF